MTDEWLDLPEQLVLDPLEDSPLPLWELRWHNETTLPDLIAALAPGLLSLTSRGLIEVRRFPTWPAPWDEGIPLTEEALAEESTRPEIWSEPTAGGVLAVHITKAGRAFL